MRRLLPKRYEAVVSFAAMTARNRPHTKALEAFLNCLHRSRPVESNRSGAANPLRGGMAGIVGLEHGA
jgi:hypothetical protein